MALTIADPTLHGGKSASAPLIAKVLTFTPDNSWLAAGEAFDAAALLQEHGGYDKAPEILAVVIESKGGYVFRWDRAAKKILAYYSDLSEATDGVMIPVPDATDISGVGAVEALILAR